MKLVDNKKVLGKYSNCILCDNEIYDPQKIRIFVERHHHRAVYFSYHINCVREIIEKVKK